MSSVRCDDQSRGEKEKEEKNRFEDGGRNEDPRYKGNL